MRCKDCGNKVFIVNGKEGTHHYASTNPELDSSKYSIPFFCDICGSIKFPYRAIRDIVFIWPLVKETFQKDGLIEIPEQFKKFYLSDLGIVLSAGPGYYDNKRFHPSEGLRVGMRVIYDKSVLSETYVKGNDGKKYFIKICGYLDVRCVVEE